MAEPLALLLDDQEGVEAPAVGAQFSPFVQLFGSSLRMSQYEGMGGCLGRSPPTLSIPTIVTTITIIHPLS